VSEDLLPIDPRDPAVAPPATAAADPRLGHLLGRDPEPLVVLLGFPSDEGVRRNGGRTGASEAPREIRRWLYRMTPDGEDTVASRRLFERTADLGDVVVTGDLEADQERLGRVVGAQLSRGRMPVILGGGHEVAFGHFLGWVRAERPLEILNWDAHADVREPVASQGNSGTPFRQALEHPSGLGQRYRVVGLQPHAVAAAHVAWLVDRGGAVLFRHQVDRAAVDAVYGDCRVDTLVSFDLDAVDGAAAPGVSAPATGGLPVDLWLAAAELAGECARVRSIDLAEVNPRYDVDGRTARLGALTIWRFLRGLTRRRPAPGGVTG
jgi:formiminoglutamase